MWSAGLSASGTEAQSIDDAARAVDTLGASWAWYRAGQQLELVREGATRFDWPRTLVPSMLHDACAECGWVAWPTGRSELALGWLLAPAAFAPDARLAALARAIGEQMQTDALLRAQNVQRVLYDIAYLASSISERTEFLQAIHERLGTLIDAENFYLALYDRETGAVTYPYYIDLIDTEAVDANHMDMVDPERLSLTGYVLTTGQPLLIDEKGIVEATVAGRFHCVGHRPKFWMGAPLKNASDEVFGMLTMQVYDASRIYSAEDRALFLVVARHVAMALDRILHRVGLEAEVARRTAELSRLNDTLRAEIAERERAQHLQAALFEIAELSSQSVEIGKFFRSLHEIVGGLLYAKNFYVALFDPATAEVSFPYYIDEALRDVPAPRRGERGLTEYVIRRRVPCLFDTDDAVRLVEAGEISLDCENIRLRSWLGVPMFDGDVVRGVLVVQSYSSSVRYDGRDQELLTFVSRHIDTALSRRRVAEAQHAANLELEARVLARTQELDEANARLLHENYHDALTGLPNRTHLYERLEAAWHGYSRRGVPLSVLFIDLDRFKVINDSLGHLFGDALLVEVAARLRECLRRDDLLARLGGDEFAVVVPGASLQTVLSLAERILAAFDAPFNIDEQTVFTSCSVGVVSADSAFHLKPADLLRDADAAMYRVKNRGRDSFTVFNQQMRRELSDQIETEGALRNALKRDDELVPYFQPIVDIATGELVALEALIRWRQPNGEIWAPGRFLPAVEGLKLIGRLDMYMLARVAEILSQREHIDWPLVQVNLSSYSITRPEFANELLELLKRYDVHPSRISLELTEGALIAEPDLARNTMQSLADSGMCVVLDDFGTGFSSLSYVHQYRFSGLKIDKSFVLELTHSTRSRAIVRAIVRMAESLELTVVAEGIEDEPTLELLRTIGAAHGQGYHLARPMSLEDLMSSPLAPRSKALEQ
ncbi:Diguanylate cyclase (GGDEF) domain-containing protein [Paraburkholderia piptadeniae]|uniref:Diguanylate cyclase (GGDEF) domain-containing protein n=1 Tax=Paraburkholderia piptadeniae TaxID=1701573 RepID=A0A1N7SWQ1_9BURK|nr:EAL domain-containing protein [Paraburkholderia piptadeniae]SIT51808.1 Diguanylate cyclase (GGDEF) domain-containing protein [Paraburkholderia piptadeniae]